MNNTLLNQPNAVSVLNSLVRTLKIPVSFFTVKNSLQEHPDYPSLLSLSDCLTSWNIPNEGFKVDLDTCKLEELTFPFIAHLSNDGGQFILVRGMTGEKIQFSDERRKRGTIDKKEFSNHWDGIILYAERDNGSGEKAYTQALVKGWFNLARLPFLILVIVAGIVYTIDYGHITLSYLSLLILNLAGMFVSVLLLMHSVNANSPFVQNLCSLGKKNDCNAILKSEAAKVTSWLSWSEVGLFYFSGSFICLLFFPASIGVMSWLTLLCIPYTFYSIGYQIKIKNWCILCCSLQSIIWLEAIIYALKGNFFRTADLNLQDVSLSSYLLSFLFPIAIWSFIKPFLIKSEHITPLKQQLKKFKYNSQLFSQILGSQTKYAVTADLMPILLGNPNAETVITMVSNPYCGPCATTHKMLDEWIKQRDDLQLQIVFTTANHDDDDRTKVARHATALSLIEDKGSVENALNEWYGSTDKNYDTWAAKYPVTFHDRIHAITEKQKEWCKMAEISFTPTILINGYKLVDPYQLDDVKFLLG